jgi:hypothetical protein
LVGTLVATAQIRAERRAKQKIASKASRLSRRIVGSMAALELCQPQE